MNKKRVEDTTFFGFLQRFQEAVQEGFVLSDTVDNFPVTYMGYYFAGVVKPENTVSSPTVAHTIDSTVEVVPNHTQAVETQGKGSPSGQKGTQKKGK